MEGKSVRRGYPDRALDDSHVLFAARRGLLSHRLDVVEGLKTAQVVTVQRDGRCG